MKFSSVTSLCVLETVEPAYDECRHVRIDHERLTQVCDAVGPGDLRLTTWDEPVFDRSHADRLAGQILLFNSVNFCYWGEPKWEIELGGETLGGSMAMLGAIKRALDEGRPVLDGAYLASVTEADFEQITRGRGRLHLIPERVRIWNEVGRTLAGEFEGRFTNAIAAAGGDALALVALLVDRFPSFDDTWQFHGRPVHLYKRAQLAAAQLYEAFGGSGWGDLARTAHLTVFADYKVPQVLRRLGVLVYDDELADTVDSKTLIPAGDEREVEIRVATVWAAELMRRALVPRLPHITALHIDYWLWFAGRYQGPDVRPFHRTLTTAY